MNNVALEFKRALNLQGGSKISPPCKNLLDLYKNPPKIHNSKPFDYKKEKCVLYYKNKYNSFLELTSYLKGVDINDKDYALVSEFLESCSIDEAEVFSLILQRCHKNPTNFKSYKKELGMVVIQILPKTYTRVTIQVKNGYIKVNRGILTEQWKQTFRRLFKSFIGTLDIILTGKVAYIHDVWYNTPTKSRLVLLYNFVNTKTVKVLKPYFYINEEDWLPHHQLVNVLVKPINGSYEDTYLRKPKE